jgi:hypothetical protein
MRGAWFAALVLANISAAAIAQKVDFAPIKPVPVQPAAKMVLPPEQYDRFYDGDLTIRIVPDLISLYAACGMEKPGMLACAWHNAKSCVIYMVEDRVMREKGYNTGILLRHEIGHCNGWPGDHPDRRPLPWPSTHLVPPEERINR